MSRKINSAIIGYGETKFAKYRDAIGRTNFTEQCMAAVEAIKDAGISKNEIDGLIAIPPLDHEVSWSMDLAEYLQIEPTFLDNMFFGGAAGNAGILYASAAIEMGLCSTVLLVGGSAMDPKVASNYGSEESVPFERDFDTIYGPMGDNSAYALIKQRYMYEFGATDEQIAKIVVNAHHHSSQFDNALLGYPVTVEEVLNSRMICDPLHLLEIVMPCVGASALIVTSAERAKDSPHKPVYVKGGGLAIDRGMWTPAYGRKASLTTSPVASAAKQAFKMAQMGIDEIDFLQLYDCYSITVLIAMEDVGLCKKGEGAAYLDDTDISINGPMPINTDGGQLGRGQSYGACHFMGSVEATRQLMGRAGALQVKEAQHGLVNGNGGAMANQCVLILGNTI